MAKNPSLKIGEHKSREGGLTEKGRKKLNRETGSNLKPGVKNAPKSRDDFMRKGRFLTRFFGQKDLPPLKKPNGKPTRLALSAANWGEPVPTSEGAARRLAAKGRRLIQRAEAMDKKKKQKMSQTQGVLYLSNGMLKIPLARKGDWIHPIYGSVSFTDDDFNSIISNFKNKALGFESYITHGHPLEKENKEEYLELAKSVDGERKKGDIKDIFIEGDYLYGISEAKKDTFEAVKEGEFDYNSGEFIRNFTDKSTGKNLGTVLVRTALTNSPFIPLGKKVETFSTNSASPCPHSLTNFVVELSIEKLSESENIYKDTNNMSEATNNEVLTTPLETQEEVTETKAEATTDLNIEELINNAVTKAVSAVKEQLTPDPVKTVVEEVKEEDPAAPLNVEKLVEKAVANLATKYEENMKGVKSTYDQIVDDLKGKVETLNKALTILYRYNRI